MTRICAACPEHGGGVRELRDLHHALDDYRAALPEARAFSTNAAEASYTGRILPPILRDQR